MLRKNKIENLLIWHQLRCVADVFYVIRQLSDDFSLLSERFIDLSVHFLNLSVYFPKLSLIYLTNSKIKLADKNIKRSENVAGKTFSDLF